MGKEAVADYRRLAEQLEGASKALEGSRGRVGRKGKGIAPLLEVAAAEAGGDVGGEVGTDAVGSGGVLGGIGEVGESAGEGMRDGVADDGVLVDEVEGDGVVIGEAGVDGRVGDAIGAAGGGEADAAGEVLARGVEGDGGAAGEGQRGRSGGREVKQLDAKVLEALLFSTRHPLTAQRLGELIDVPSVKALRLAIGELNRQYEEGGRSFRIEQVAGGYQMLTLPAYGPLLNKLHQREIDSKLSRSAVETLAIIAYKQPVLRAEVEAIRGVASGETIRSLMEKHLVKIAGRAEEAGRPILYGTTKRFLEVFGLNSLKELPKDEKTQPPVAAGEGEVTVEAVGTADERR